MTPRLRTLVTAGAGVAAVALTSTLIAAPAGAASSTATTTKSTTTEARYRAAAGWLTTQFVTGTTHLPAPSGDHFEGTFGSTRYVSYGENDDVLFALAAAKVGADKAKVASDYLRKHVADYTYINTTSPSDGGIGKLAVGALVEGGTATDFGGYNLMAALKKDECVATDTACTPGEAANIYSSVSESFVLIAEARAAAKYAPSTAAKTYFASLQCASGGFTSDTAACGTGDADIDATSYAIMAMQAMGTTGSQLTRAESWLQGQQNKAGYWTVGGIANVNSTGLATSALQGVHAGTGSARTWLRTQQVGPGPAAGAMRYGGTFTPTTTSATSPSVLATAQGVVGLLSNSTLATVTAAKSNAGVGFFKPTVHATKTEKRGKAYTVSGGGFAAGEKLTVTRGSTAVAVVTVTPSGSYSLRVTVPAKAKPGATTYRIVGRSTGLTASAPVTVVR